MIEVAHSSDPDDIASFLVLENCIEGGWTKTMLEQALESGSSKFLKASHGDSIVGYINYSEILDEVEINAVAVLPSFRRQGVAKKLLNELVKISKENEARSIFLEVNEFNLSAIALYRSLGFAKIGLRKNYYGNQAALIFHKQLQQ